MSIPNDWFVLPSVLYSFSPAPSTHLWISFSTALTPRSSWEFNGSVGSSATFVFIFSLRASECNMFKYYFWGTSCVLVSGWEFFFCFFFLRRKKEKGGGGVTWSLAGMINGENFQCWCCSNNGSHARKKKKINLTFKLYTIDPNEKNVGKKASQFLTLWILLQHMFRLKKSLWLHRSWRK